MFRIKYFLFLITLLATIAFVAASGCAKKEAPPSTGSQGEQAKQEQAKGPDYPKQTITLVSAGSPGGGNDTAARTIQPFLQKEMGQVVLVENRPGGGTLIAANYVGSSKPDGYTFLVVPIPANPLTHLMNAAEAKQKFLDLVPIGCWLNDDNSPLVVRGDSPYKTLDDFINAAKEKPLSLALGGGANTADHIVYALLAERTGAKFNVAPFGGAGDALAAVKGGHAQAALVSVSAASAMAKSGDIRILAMSSANRVEFLPDVPTFKELGYDIVEPFRVGLMAPPGTPEEIAKIAGEKLFAAANSPEFKNRAKELGMPAGTPLNREEFTKICKESDERMRSSVYPLLQKYAIK